MESNSFFETKIETLNSSGQGIASLDGLKVFIELALPEEKVKAKCTVKKKNYALADLVEIQERSSDRVEPICPIFTQCGGCQIMHLKEEKQLEYKTKRVQEALIRIGKITDVTPLSCIRSPETLYYRNKIQLPFFEKEKGVGLGLYQKNSHDIVEVQTCYIHSELGQKIYESLLELMKDLPLKVFNPVSQKGFLRHLLIRTGVRTRHSLIVFITSSHQHKEILKKVGQTLMMKHPEVKGVLQSVNQKRFNSILGETSTTLVGEDHLYEEILGHRFKMSAHAFFQVNPFQAINLYQTALEFADLHAEDSLLDAYCGVGVFSILAASRVKKVLGIECVPSAIEDANENAKLNHLTNTEFKCGEVERVIDQVGSFDVAIINPPRKGCDLKVLEALSTKKIKKIVYVSCDPATLARDLAYLIEKGFDLIKVQPLDMFPQTTHVESVALLINRSFS